MTRRICVVPLVLSLLWLVCLTGSAWASYEGVMVAPKLLFTGSDSSVSVSVVTEARNPAPAGVPVVVTLRPDSAGGVFRTLFSGTTDSDGTVRVGFTVPDVPEGSYTLRALVTGAAETLDAQVSVLTGATLIIETDKPIYKPSQTIHGRVLLLNNALRPLVGDVELEISDGKGIKIHKATLTTNEYGVAPFELQLADYLNFGTWKITATSGDQSTSSDVTVEKYVLPKFEVNVDLVRGYFMPNEEIEGSVTANYFFGKPVEGTLNITAKRYIGEWDEYATFTGSVVNGAAQFTLPPVQYVAGTPEGGGGGNVILDVTVTDTSDHAEKSTLMLKVVGSEVVLQLIPMSSVLKPGMPLEILVVTKDPLGTPRNETVDLTANFYVQNEWQAVVDTTTVNTQNGVTLVTFSVPTGCYEGNLSASIGANVSAYLSLAAAYSPSASFVHLVQVTTGVPQVGDTIEFQVYRTEGDRVYYEVVAAGRSVLTEVTREETIRFTATPEMMSGAKLIAYVINPNSEVSADSLPFEVSGANLGNLTAEFNADTVAPGDTVSVALNAGAQAMLGVAVVDQSVFALAKGRLNLQQIFAELERIFMEPQIEIHEQDPWWGSAWTHGAEDVFNEAGLQVVSTAGLLVPTGAEVFRDWIDFGGEVPAGEGGGIPPAPTEGGGQNGELAEVSRVRQFFPETWVWVPDLLTDESGRATLDLTAPDSITTWKLRGVATSQNGLSLAEADLTVFQDFFVDPDLPYEVTRGDEFPIRVQLYNYLESSQEVFVEIEEGDWFELLSPASQSVTIPPSSVIGIDFPIRPTQLGLHPLQLTARSTQRADAVRKDLLVAAEGSELKSLTNGILHGGDSVALDTSLSPDIVPDSGKAYLRIMPSMVSQTMSGLDDLLQMPYGCGEQNMINFAPDVEVLRYLEATDQMTPELSAKAEQFINVGYQRELTYRHDDGSFSAFGENDEEGSLWLTAFVLSVFSSARDVRTIDDMVLSSATAWLAHKQKPDGSWEPSGFLYHQDMAGGSMEGNYALTAYVALALAEYGGGSNTSLTNARNFLESRLTQVSDNAFSLAVGSLALIKLGSSYAGQALDLLMSLAQHDSHGTYWTPYNIETTSYAALSLMAADRLGEAGACIDWISAQRNSFGGFGTTQDTVMAFRALVEATLRASRDISLSIVVVQGETTVAQFTVNSQNFDVMQVLELPTNAEFNLSATGTGSVSYQLERKFNVLADALPPDRDMTLSVDYDTSHIAVDDIVDVTVAVAYTGSATGTGMAIIDVGVPTGFAAVQESLSALVDAGTVTRTETPARKVVFYLNNLYPSGPLQFTFQLRALFPVKAEIPESKAYAYYSPEIHATIQPGKIDVSQASGEGEAEEHPDDQGEGEEEVRSDDQGEGEGEIEQENGGEGEEEHGREKETHEGGDGEREKETEGEGPAPSPTSTCVIATAASRTRWATELGALRQVRDNALLPSRLGEVLARQYYRLMGYE